MKPKLIIFDLDGTICVNPEFYKKIYSGTLNKVVEQQRGQEGLDMLQYCRETYDGKGELALFALNIPFVRWAEFLIEANLSAINPRPDLVEAFKRIKARKVIYTGSPTKMAHRIISKLGFSVEDFDIIFGWREPELFPLKWTCSSVVFDMILRGFLLAPKEALSVGDNWETDLLPAKSIGVPTVKIGKVDHNSDMCFADINKFLKSII